MKSVRFRAAGLFISLAALFFASCANPTAPAIPAAPAPASSSSAVSIVDSSWGVILEAVLDSSKALTSTVWLDREIADYNAGHTDDQWRLIRGAVPPLAEAPDVRAVVVETTYYHVISERTIRRADLPAVRAELRAALLAGQALYMDRDPPPPQHIPTEYEKWALYLVAADGRILYEEHCPSEAVFRERRPLYYQQAHADGNGEYVVEGRIYTPPA